MSCTLRKIGRRLLPFLTVLSTLATALAADPQRIPEPMSGEKLARQYCAACHLFPEPALLDKKSWREGPLPRMKIRMGLFPSMVESHPEAELLKATGVFPEVPMISEEDWRKIHDYYLASAPETPIAQDSKEPIALGLKTFLVELPKVIRPPATTTMAQIDEKSGQIYVGDELEGMLKIFDSRGEPQYSISATNVPVYFHPTTEGGYLINIGRFRPSEDPHGQVVILERQHERLQIKKVILDKLPRPAHAAFADFNGDGKVDFALCMFGNNVGRFSWFEDLGHDRFYEHILVPKPGALRSVVHDFNHDGFPDLAVLLAQATEGLMILLNDGKGNFSTHDAFQTSPIYGHTYFELADFNSDGELDALVTNGDNGEYTSPLKKYHGIRIYLNRGKQKFEEVFFYPLNGAYKAVARDFDQDGDLDIAAISFFPDYENGPRESFVYLEHQGGMKFKAATFRECIAGRWLTMDAGDIDRDGDLDIVLGSYIRGPGTVPSFLTDMWEKRGRAFQILRNSTRSEENKP